MRKWAKVKEFDPNSQDPDSIVVMKDPTDIKVHGKGQMGGGSKPTPQTYIMKSGNGALHGSAPASKQRLRG